MQPSHIPAPSNHCLPQFLLLFETAARKVRRKLCVIFPCNRFDGRLRLVATTPIYDEAHLKMMGRFTDAWKTRVATDHNPGAGADGGPGG